MKKILLLAMVALLSVSTISCSSDDNSSSNYKSNILGTWIDSKIFFLDKNKKVIGEVNADDNDGCGIDEREFKENVVNYTYFYRFIAGSINECKTETGTDKYSIKGNKLIIESEDDGERYIEEAEIIELNANKFVFLLLEKLDEEDIDGEDFPEGTTYLKFEYVRK